METTNLTFEQAIGKYLERVVEATSRWSGWLAEHEQALLLGEYARLESHASSAHKLFTELSGLTDERQRLLDQASEDAGCKFSSIKQLARTLPAWQLQEFRELLLAAERRMSHLKRLNLAVWVLVSQCSRMTNEMVQLFVRGKPESSVYIDSPMADDQGGQLLDARA